MKKVLLSLFVLMLTACTLSAQVNVSTTSQSSSCSANGTVTVNVTGAQPPITYYVNGTPVSTQPSLNYTINGFSPGIYSIKVIDGGGQASSPLNVTVGGTYLEPVLTIQKSGCNLTANVTNGISPYEYAIASSPSGPYSAYQSNNVFTAPLSTSGYIKVKDGCDNIYTASIDLGFAEMSINVDCSVNTNSPGLYDVEVLGISGGVPPFQVQCVSGSYNQTLNGAGVFSGLSDCTYSITVTDNCGNVKNFQKRSCIKPNVSLDCINCENGQVTLSASGGYPGYTYSVSLGNYPVNTTFTNTTGIFTGLPAPYNGKNYYYRLEDQCHYTPSKPAFCYDDNLNCLSVSFDGRIEYTLATDYLGYNPMFPITIDCIGCASPITSVTVNSAGQLPVIFDGMMSGSQQFTITDKCGNQYFSESTCITEFEAFMSFTSGGGGGGGGGGGASAGAGGAGGRRVIPSRASPLCPKSVRAGGGASTGPPG